MSPAELEQELPHMNDLERPGPVSTAVAIGTKEALAFKRAGNRPDADGRWLRLVLRSADPHPEAIARRRIVFEPDYHDPPTWRGPDSKPINVIPLRMTPVERGIEHWTDDPTMAELESEWQANGTVGGVKVPAEYRSFVHKTVAALKASGREVTAQTIADSISRWVPERDALEIGNALRRANP